MRRHTLELDGDVLDWVMRVNFFAPARMTLAVLDRMIHREGGRSEGTIVNVSSVAGRLGNANEAAYSASKFALCGWSESLAVDLYDTGIAVRLVNPGPVDTEIWDLPGNDAPIFDVAKISSEEMALGIIEAMEGNRFELYLPDMLAVVAAKTSDPGPFIEGMAQAARSARSSGGTP